MTVRKLANRKLNEQFYFSVEGETELWYLDWLKEKINAEASIAATVSFVCKKISPEKMVRKYIFADEITHIFDYESNDKEHVTNFNNILTQMRKAERLKKGFNYRLGYSNFAFELWIILHKTDFYTQLNNRKQYLKCINDIYKEKFPGLSEYKEEANFKRILNKLTLNDVIDAIKRSGEIERKNIDNGYIRQNCTKKQCDSDKCRKNKCYYQENPSLSVGKIIKGIFTKCGLNAD